MRVLVTGSSGMIGTNLSLRLLDEGHEVVGVDCRDNPWTGRIQTVIQDLTVQTKQCCAELAKLRSFDLVVHLAAHAKVYELVLNPQRAFQNVAMVFNALEFARENGLPVIFGSSREVYGDIHRHVTDERCADFVVAESPYSASKLAGEAFVYSYAQCYKMRYLVFRFSNVYGRFDNDINRMYRVVPGFMNQISRGEQITIYGREKVLDFTYIDDCVDGIVKGIEHFLDNRLSNETINLAYGEGNTLTQLAQFIAEQLGVELRVEYCPSRPGEVKRYVADITKARKMLGYQPRVPLADGIGRAVEWVQRFTGGGQAVPLAPSVLR